jgi:hypothetical protein
MTSKFSRRDVIRIAAGSLAVVGAARTRFAWSAPINATVPVVDVHCHVFNGCDLPVAGFLAHWLLGIGVPRAIVKVAHPLLVEFQSGIWDRATGDRELADLEALLVSPCTAPAAAIAPAPLRLDQFLAHSSLPMLNPHGMMKVLEVQAAHTARTEAQMQELYAADPEARAWFDGELSSPLGMEIAAGPFSRTGRLVVAVFSKLSAQFGRFFAVGQQSRLQVASQFLSENSTPSLAVPMLVDYDAWMDWGHGAWVSQDKQVKMLSAISRLSMLGKLPCGTASAKVLHPFAAFDPRRDADEDELGLRKYAALRKANPQTAWQNWKTTMKPAALQAGSFGNVRRAVEDDGFIGVKVYPPVGFLPMGNLKFKASPVWDDDTRELMDVALHRLYAWCEDLQIPITAHAGTGNAFGVTLRDCAGPSGWASVMEQYKRLRLNLGHFGHENRAWLGDAVELMEQHETVFADIADSSIEQAKLDGYLQDLFSAGLDRKDGVRRRMMYGSDWFMDKLVTGNTNGYYAAMSTAFNAKFAADAGFATSFSGGAALRFLGLDDPANLNRQRLVAFYHQTGAALPLWLA